MIHRQFAVALMLTVPALASAQTRKVEQQPTMTVSPSEPAIYSLSELYSFADKVAIIRVVAGTTEAYDNALYKGEVLVPFKGTVVGQIVYFGPFVGTEIGTEYLLFLKDQPERIHPKDKANGFAIVKYSKVFNEGYSSMLTSYECVFDGKSAKKQCDYAVRVCTDYIKLPKSVPTAPADDTDTPFGCRWVKRDRLISEIAALAPPEIQ